MSQIALLGAIELGLLYGLVALGVFLSFRVLNFPDLTVDGSLPLGAATAATAMVAGVDPFLASLAAMAAGALAGLVTAFLNLRLKILHLLASILTMIALWSVNLWIMGRPNTALLGEDTVFTPFAGLGLPYFWLQPLVVGAVVVVVGGLLVLFLTSQTGLAMRATGANGRMARAQGIATGRMTYLGMALSNALVALAGALFAQIQGGADVAMGVGVIVVGLAAVILGEAVLPTRTMVLAVLACVVGSILYRLAVALAIATDGIEAQDLKFVTAVLVVIAMVLPGSGSRLRRHLARRRAP